MNNLIELQDVNLIRNGKALLKEVNWQVKENECWAILGSMEQENQPSSNC